MICSRCHCPFEVDPNDGRPNYWHHCNDLDEGVYAATTNPSFNSWRRGEPTGEDSRNKMIRYDYRRRVYDR
jgi:hypothetical protein